MPRPRTIAIGTLAVLLAAAPFIPRGGGDDGSLRPSGKQQYAASLTADTAGPGQVTPALRAEIDRVVDQGRALGRLSTRQSPDTLARDLVRCADFEGQHYCLGSGWTESTEAQVQARSATALRTSASRSSARASIAPTSTGDLDVASTLQRAAALSPAERAASERAELTRAARSVAKVWLLRHEIEGVPLPAGFVARHPEARAATTSTSHALGAAKPSATPTTPTPPPTAAPSPPKTIADYPRRATVLSARRVADQERTYWCGPTTMQMITWGWKKKDLGQAHWADKLGTTSGGTAISDMVRVVNSSTGWDGEKYAGPYVTLDISGYTYKQWLLLQMRHIVDYHAPVILHPILLKRFYPYLDDDASGHFQTGRGYDKNGTRAAQIGYFEPWNQQRFDPSEPYISRVQWRSAYKSYRANEAHFQHNIGV